LLAFPSSRGPSSRRRSLRWPSEKKASLAPQFLSQTKRELGQGSFPFFSRRTAPPVAAVAAFTVDIVAL